MTIPLRIVALGFVFVTALGASVWLHDRTQEAGGAPSQEGPVKEITIRARRYAFDPARIEVRQGDILKVTLVAEDIPHGFTIDEYRISKRATPGQPVTFEFRADRSGRFVFYCGLTAEEGCSKMRGELLVR